MVIALTEATPAWWPLLSDEGPIGFPSVDPPLATLCGLIAVISAPWLWSALPRARVGLAAIPTQLDKGAVTR